MKDIFVIEHIKELCKQRNWSYYRLAKESGIPYSSISTMLNKQHIPSMRNLIKICDGLNIILSHFFAPIDNTISEQDKLLSMWNRLTLNEKYYVKLYISGLLKQQAPYRKINSINENYKNYRIYC